MTSQPPGDRDAHDAGRSTKIEAFALADHGPDIPRLLRNVATTMETLGRVDVLDITFKEELHTEAFVVSMTVYFTRLHDDELASQDVNEACTDDPSAAIRQRRSGEVIASLVRSGRRR